MIRSSSKSQQYCTMSAYDTLITLLLAYSSLFTISSSSSLPSIPSEIASLSKLESGLRSARLALRNVAKVKNNRELQGESEYTGYQHVHEDVKRKTEQTNVYLEGPIYKDAQLFQESYSQMEKRFKIYVYREGRKPLVHDGPCKDIYSTEGRFIHELNKPNNPFVTTNPLDAHVFFLPFSVSKMVSYLYKPLSLDMGPLIHFVEDYVKIIGDKYPFWNRSAGSDHFMLACHDWGPHISRAHPHLEKHTIRVLCNANNSEGFVAHKDASLPEINMVGGEIPEKLGGPPMKERPYLAFFAGQDHGPVRPHLFRHWLVGRDGKADDDDDKHANGMKVFRKIPSALNETYQDFMRRSKFCLCPGGFEVNSPRLVEAIYYDCIPVIIADGFVLPFSDVLNWDTFSLQVKEKDIPRLKEILENVPLAACEEMQSKIREVRRHFLFNQSPQRYDLFHMVLHSIWLRRLNIQLNYT